MSEREMDGTGRNGGIPSCLEPLTSVFALLLSEAGSVIQANHAFTRHAAAESGARPSACPFRAPVFSRLALMPEIGADGLVFLGPATLCTPDGVEHTLRAAVWRHSSGYLVVGEPETCDMEALSQSLLVLHEQVVGLNTELARRRRGIERADEDLLKLVFTDPVTGIANRRHFDERLKAEVYRNARYGSPFSVVLMDLDDFKQVNDTYGHAAGDRMLRVVASLLQKSIRPTDLAARYGGDEFAVLLPETGVFGAQLMSERMLETAAQESAQLPRPVSVSIGVAMFGKGDTVDSLIERADRALYESKRRGPGRVCVSAGTERDRRLDGQRVSAPGLSALASQTPEQGPAG